MFIKSITTTDNLYITFRDYSNRFQYIPFKPLEI